MNYNCHAQPKFILNFSVHNAKGGNMRKTLFLLALLCMVLSNQTANASDLFRVKGIFYDNSRVPAFMYVNDNVKPQKEGNATCKSYFIFYTTGKCGIKDAMDDGNITKVNSVDKEFKNYGLLYQLTTIKVYGE